MNIKDLARHICEHTDTEREFVHFGHIYIPVSIYNGGGEDYLIKTDASYVSDNFVNSQNTFDVIKEIVNPKILFFHKERGIELNHFGLSSIEKMEERIKQDVGYSICHILYRIEREEIFIGSGVYLIFAYSREAWDAEVQCMCIMPG